MKIRIRNAGLANKGAEALLRTIQSQLTTRIPAANFEVESAAFRGPHRQRSVSLGFRTVNDLGGWPARAERLLSRSAIQPTLLVDASGFGYGDGWKLRSATETIARAGRAVSYGGAFVFAPQAFGELTDPDAASVYRKLFAQASLIGVRDAVSKDHLQQLIGPDERVFDCPDIAFRFDGHRKFIDQEIAGIAPRPARRLVAVAPSRKVYQRLQKQSPAAARFYIDLLGTICDRIEQDGSKVIYVPHEIRDHKRKVSDDRTICRMIPGAGNASRFAAIDCLDAGQLKAIIGRCDFLVGSRFHALVASLSLNKPVIALGWSHKYKELLDAFELRDFAHSASELCSDPQDKTVVEGLLAQIATWLRQGPPKMNPSNIQKIHQRVDEYFDQVAVCCHQQQTKTLAA